MKAYLLSFHRCSKSARYGFDFFQIESRKEGLFVTFPSDKFLAGFMEDIRFDTQMKRFQVPEKNPGESVRKNDKMIEHIIFKSLPPRSPPPVPLYTEKDGTVRFIPASNEEEVLAHWRSCFGRE